MSIFLIVFCFMFIVFRGGSAALSKRLRLYFLAPPERRLESVFTSTVGGAPLLVLRGKPLLLLPICWTQKVIAIHPAAVFSSVVPYQALTPRLAGTSNFASLRSRCSVAYRLFAIALYAYPKAGGQGLLGQSSTAALRTITIPLGGHGSHSRPGGRNTEFWFSFAPPWGVALKNHGLHSGRVSPDHGHSTARGRASLIRSPKVSAVPFSASGKPLAFTILLDAICSLLNKSALNALTALRRKILCL
jgi:hypothetical protein